MKRVLTAALLIPAVLYLVFLAHPLLFLAAVVLVAGLCFHEYSALVRGHGLALVRPFGFVAGLLVLLVPGPEPLILTLLALIGLVLALRADSPAQVLPLAAATLLGIIYVFGAWRCAIGLRDIHPHWLAFALILNWVGDIAAYATGRAIGRHRLAPQLSPKKTWEGSAGSAVLSALFGGLYLPTFLPAVSVAQAVALAVAGNVAGQLGDLAESALKRGAGVKDSGTLLPGHGGMLDRVDSALFTLPVVYLWVLRPWG